MKYMAYTQAKTRAHNQKSSVSGTKSKIIAGAIGITAIAGGAGYVVNDAIQPSDITSPEPVYSISYYKLRKTKQTLASLAVRADDEAPTEFNSNNYVPTGWSDANDSGCDTRYDVLFSTLSKAKQGDTKCKIQSGELFDYYTGEIVTDTTKIHIDHVVSKRMPGIAVVINGTQILGKNMLMMKNAFSSPFQLKLTRRKARKTLPTGSPAMRTIGASI